MAFVSSASIGRSPPVQTTTAPKLVFPPINQLTPSRCCETGRPIMVDPLTGSTVCSCQLKHGVPAYLSRVPSLPENIYGSPSNPAFPPNMIMGADATSAFYPMGAKPERQTDVVKTSPPGGTSPYYIDHLMAAHPYNAFYSGFDLNSARRKNATRETTSALKAWLYEHRKNPYPTKGEKIMLAIITRMTLTQVSTWFANARRRLKKENKLDDKDADLSDIDIEDKPENTSVSSMSDDDDKRKVTTDLSDISDAEESTSRDLLSPNCDAVTSFGNSTVSYTHRFISAENPKDIHTDRSLVLKENSKNMRSDRSLGLLDTSKNTHTDRSLPEDKAVTKGHVIKYPNGIQSPRRCDIPKIDTSRDRGSSSDNSPQPKPKIWSISEIIRPVSGSDST